MKLFVGIVLMTLVGSSYGGITTIKLQDSSNSIPAFLRTMKFGSRLLKNRGSRDILSIPNDIVQSIIGIFRSIGKIVSGRVIEGITDLLRTFPSLTRNIFNDLSSSSPSIPVCPDGDLAFNRASGKWECRSEAGSSFGAPQSNPSYSVWSRGSGTSPMGGLSPLTGDGYAVQPRERPLLGTSGVDGVSGYRPIYGASSGSQFLPSENRMAYG